MPVRQQNNTILPVKNTRLVEAATDTTRNLLAAHRANVANAIEASGYPITVYNRLQQGRRCTCSFHRKELLDKKGNLSQGMIDTLVTGMPSGIEEYGDEPTHRKTVEGGRVQLVQSFHPNSTALDAPDGFDSGDGEVVNLVGGKGPGPNDDSLGSLDDVFDLDDLDNEPNRLFIGSGTSCGICFGTTYVGGFEPLFGHRTICDATLAHTIELCELDAQSSPNAFNVFYRGSVTFDIVVPSALQFAVYPRVFDNKTTVPVTDYVLEISTNGSTWEVVTPHSILSICTGLPSRVRISPTGNDGVRFTHLELLFSQRPSSAPFKGDFPDVQKLVTLSLADALSSCTIIVPGDLFLNRWSIVIDHLPGLSRHWMVNTVQPRRNQFGDVYDTALDARVQDLNELGQLLRPLSISKDPLV